MERWDQNNLDARYHDQILKCSVTAWNQRGYQASVMQGMVRDDMPAMFPCGLNAQPSVGETTKGVLFQSGNKLSDRLLFIRGNLSNIRRAENGETILQAPDDPDTYIKLSGGSIEIYGNVKFMDGAEVKRATGFKAVAAKGDKDTKGHALL